ncbi:Esterase citA [Paramyrothecium foliicola]|nr:Esterase citA [Paramyrothecium foliicola]
MDEDLILPRILCLHGGGTNAEILATQCRGITTNLKQYFRFVYVNGPFTASPHEDIAAVYGDMGPFYRWLRWLPEHEPIADEDAARMVMDAILGAMKKDMGTGPWAGVFGFSQGAKIAANLLWMQERAVKNGLKPLTNFEFGVVLAGLPPWLHFDTRLPIPERYVDNAGGYATDFQDWPEANEGEHVLSKPTLHVLGLQDPDVEKHRVLMEKYCKKGTTKLIEWDGGHRVPVEPQYVRQIVKHILDMGEDADMLWGF